MPHRALLALGLSLVVLASGCSSPPPTMWDADRARLEAALEQLDDASTPGAVRLRLALLDERARLSGDLLELRELEEALDSALEERGPARWLRLQRARFFLHVHRPDLARRELDRSAREFGATDERDLSAFELDIALQTRPLEIDASQLEELVSHGAPWSNLARLAHWTSLTSAVRADALYAKATEAVSAKEMRAYAWLELQRGILQISQGRVEEALDHYRTADRAYSGYWLIEEHTAEALALKGEVRAAQALYARALDRSGRPEIARALAALVERDDPARAEALRRRADRADQLACELYPQLAADHPASPVSRIPRPAAACRAARSSRGSAILPGAGDWEPATPR